MCAAARRVAAPRRVRGEGEAAASGGPAVGGSRPRSGPVLLPEEGEAAGGGDSAPPQRVRRTHTNLVQHPEGAAHR